ncbi:Low-affinity potassium transport protein [Colletotrichum aenigma]|uniref:Low-affinity potassium transport protein n=1 Tax=Colletotrichum aenigma TaxID=1215731 RepID=UPI001872F77B|nr:Low-affinity potassium transport protein [Colletotrichum aenigma]KAF5519174.1 Low-affinity potassium transport protein [Colletotrichum aenigma]
MTNPSRHPYGDENGISDEAHDMLTPRSSPRSGSGIRSFLPPLNFITLHYAYFIGTSLLASAVFYASSNPRGSISYVDALFLVVSAITEAGLNNVNLSQMTVWQQAYFVLITMGLLILAGNTAYPLFLRLIFWAALKVLRLTTAEGRHGELKNTLEFILKYPRRVYTNLFPSRPTWWLFFMVVLINGIDWVAFEVLSIGNPVIEAIPVGARVLDGLFQALAVRSGGFYLIPISSAYRSCTSS